MKPTVAILTYCAHPALAYGTLLVFKSLRIGFPNARIEVYDNGSHPEVRDAIMRAAADVDATFTALNPRHWVEYIRWLLMERDHDGAPLVMVDPDVAFWRPVEDWHFGDALMAGRFMPAVSTTAIVGHARLHPSLLWINDVERLRGEMPSRGMDPRLAAIDGQVHFWDTLSSAYEHLAHRCARFGVDELDCYDHLFFGAHLPLVDVNLGRSFDVIREGHRAAAAGDIPALRGVWRAQDAYFAGQVDARGPEQIATVVRQNARTRVDSQLRSMQAIQGWQKLEYDEAELMHLIDALTQRVTSAPAHLL